MPEPKAKTAVAIDAELSRRIDRVCEQRDENRSNVVERMLRNAIDDEEAFVRRMEQPLVRTFVEMMSKHPSLLVPMPPKLS